MLHKQRGQIDWNSENEIHENNVLAYEKWL